MLGTKLLLLSLVVYVSGQGVSYYGSSNVRNQSRLPPRPLGSYRPANSPNNAEPIRPVYNPPPVNPAPQPDQPIYQPPQTIYPQPPYPPARRPPYNPPMYDPEYSSPAPAPAVIYPQPVYSPIPPQPVPLQPTLRPINNYPRPLKPWTWKPVQTTETPAEVITQEIPSTPYNPLLVYPEPSSEAPSYDAKAVDPESPIESTPLPAPEEEPAVELQPLDEEVPSPSSSEVPSPDNVDPQPEPEPEPLPEVTPSSALITEEPLTDPIPDSEQQFPEPIPTAIPQPEDPEPSWPVIPGPETEPKPEFKPYQPESEPSQPESDPSQPDTANNPFEPLEPVITVPTTLPSPRPNYQPMQPPRPNYQPLPLPPVPNRPRPLPRPQPPAPRPNYRPSQPPAPIYPKPVDPIPPQPLPTPQPDNQPLQPPAPIFPVPVDPIRPQPLPRPQPDYEPLQPPAPIYPVPVDPIPPQPLPIPQPDYQPLQPPAPIFPVPIDPILPQPFPSKPPTPTPSYQPLTPPAPSPIPTTRPIPEYPTPAPSQEPPQPTSPYPIEPPTSHGPAPVPDVLPVIPISEFQCSKGNAYYTIINECDAYIECQSQRAWKHTCPDGLHFNPEALYPEYPCAYPSQVQCESTASKQIPKPTNECPNRFGFFSIFGGDCSKYIMCQEGKATIMNCPFGLVFNDQLSSCDWPENVPQCNPNAFRDFTCPMPPEDDPDLLTRYRYGSDCRMYVACQRGHPRLLRCDPGLSFDENSQVCIDTDLIPECRTTTY